MSTDYQQLVDALGSGARTDVIRAAHALGDLGDPRAVDTLIALAVTTDDAAVRDAAAVGLRELGDPRAIGPLVTLVADPRTAGHRGTLLYALEPFDCAAHAGLLFELIVEGGFEVSRQAALLLDEVRAPIDDDVLAAGLVRVEAALPALPADRAALLEDLRAWIVERTESRRAQP